MWSLGLIFLEWLACSHVVFPGNTEFDQLQLYFRHLGTMSEEDAQNLGIDKVFPHLFV